MNGMQREIEGSVFIFPMILRIRTVRPERLNWLNSVMPRQISVQLSSTIRLDMILRIKNHSFMKPEICKAFMKKLYEKDTYIKFLDATPVGMLPSISGISDTPEYKENETVQKFSNAVDVISDAMDKGTAIGYEHGPSVQAGLLTSQGIIESMFQDIITNGTDVKKAAKKAENQLNDLFSTVQ